MASNQNVNKVVYAGTTLIDLTGDDVTAGDVLSGKKFHLPSGAEGTGTIASQAAQTITPGTSDQTIAAGKYLIGAQTIAGDANLVAGNIKKDVTIFGVTGTLVGVEDAYAAISVTYPVGSTCTATNGTTTLAAADTSGQVVFVIPEPSSTPETWTVSCTDGTSTTSDTAVITKKGDFIEIELEYVPLESFATVSDANFIKMIQAAHNGTIDLQMDAGWKVGDKRTISISAFTGGGSVSHTAQSIDITIGSFANYENCGCVLQFDFVDALATGNRMHGTSTNANGYDGSEMYNTTLPALVNALPAYLRGLLIEFSCKASAGNKYTTIKTVTGNKLALRSEVEIFGTTKYSAAGEGSQIPYYTTSANRVKKRGHSGSAYNWWERSPDVSSAYNFCFVNASGTAGIKGANNAYGVAPFGCI